MIDSESGHQAIVGLPVRKSDGWSGSPSPTPTPPPTTPTTTTTPPPTTPPPTTTTTPPH